MSDVVWLMDSDFCQSCGTELADVDGYCWWCWEQLEDEWNREDDEDTIWYGEEDNVNDIPRPKDHITVRLEFKPQDCWIGVYTRKTDLFPWRYRRRWQRDIWICILPMLPIHLWWTRTEHENNDLAHRHTA